ncbi:TIGR00725 family protein [Thermotoga caldifontis]|uniref:TIGR00725 family protein n=1 Tax=Thermotoga caldifontis TaxID=1508419 RepID=UPI0005975731|nr:TIGR00725 family protein [Thermotoga caldifontis]
MNVGVVGYSGPIDQPPISEIAQLCLNLGEALAREGYTIVCGGRDGVMELVSKGARKVGGNIIGVLPVGEEGNPYLTVRIKTPFDNVTRSLVLVQTSDVVISIGGEIGTAIEVLIAYAKAKPVVLFEGTGGWTDRFAELLIEGRYLDNRKIVEVLKARSVEQILQILRKMRR